jgi:hypothetical protein
MLIAQVTRRRLMAFARVSGEVVTAIAAESSRMIVLRVARGA